MPGMSLEVIKGPGTRSTVSQPAILTVLSIKNEGSRLGDGLRWDHSLTHSLPGGTPVKTDHSVISSRGRLSQVDSAILG